jgi:fructokinase
MVSRVGSDTLGTEILHSLSAKNFDTSLIQRDPNRSTGTVKVTLSSSGDPSFFIVPDVAYDFMELSANLIEAASRSIFICFGTLAQRDARARNTIYSILDAAPCATSFLDINLRASCYSAETVSESLARADILKLNLAETGMINELLELDTNSPKELALRIMADYGVTTVLVTLGCEGVYAIEATGKQMSVPAAKVDVVDTIGAGDAFSAGFAYKYLHGAALEECCRFGNFMGALNATKQGGMPNFSEDELARFSERLLRVA